MRSNEVISRSQFFKKAAKELLADGQPHSYGEIVQYIRTQAKGTCLDGSIESNNVWQSLRSMMQEPESPYQKVKWGTYQKGSPQNLNAKPVISANRLLCEGDVPRQDQAEQLDLFIDYEEQKRQREAHEASHARERKIQETMLGIKKKFGKNAILKGLNLEDGATARERNQTIGGHQA